MREINLPKTRFEDYISFREMVNVNYLNFKKNGVLEKEIDEIIDFMYDRFFKDRIFLDDFYSFGSLSDLEGFLLESKYFSSDNIDECISHEKEHLEKIDEFGYLVKRFYVCLLNYNDKVTFAAGISIDKEGVSLDKLKEIALAPKNLSLTDRLFM